MSNTNGLGFAVWPACSVRCPSSSSGSTFQGRSVRARVAASRSASIILPRWRCNVSTNDFRTGTTIEMDGVVFRVQEFLHVKPGKGAAFVRTKLRNMKTGNTIEKTFKAGEMVSSATLEKVKMQHTYVDGNEFVFMNMETYEEERMSASIMGENNAKFVLIGMDVEVLKHNDAILGVELPKNPSYTVTKTDPGVKGNTATNALKPATIETGAQIMVPLFITEGEKIKVNIENGKYLSRDNE